MSKKFYITTPIYYANGSPHVGHFLTTTIADVLTRHYRNSLGKNNVFFTTGLDEHGTTVEQAAIKAGYFKKDIEKYTDKRAEEWEKAFKETNISFDYFVRTTHPKHKKFAQEFIQKMISNGDVYKGNYTGKYCWGCEKFLTLSDQNENGLCPIHRPEQVEEIKEQNYFFNLKKYASKIKNLIDKGDIAITPENKRREVLARIDAGIEDLSISRPKEKVGWGIEFPGDPNQTVYVWTEALINYLSSLEINSKKGFWEFAVHTLGKDISWFHNVIWPSLLLSAGYPPFKSSFVHSFLIVSGQKISKSLGNLISPSDLVQKYSVDGARYLIIKNLPLKSDSDVAWDTLDAQYQADLANGLGNLVARIAGLAKGLKFDKPKQLTIGKKVADHIENYQLDAALQSIWDDIRTADVFINERSVWNLAGKQKELALNNLVNRVRQIATDLAPFLPETSEEIIKQFAGPLIKSRKPLFPRLS